MNVCRSSNSRGAAIVGLMIVAVILLGSLLMLNTAAMVSVANTSRALEVARQDTQLGARLERITREAALRVYGVAVRDKGTRLAGEIEEVMSTAGFGALKIKSATVLDEPPAPVWFPSLAGAAEPLVPPSEELRLFSTAALDRLFHARGAHSVCESVPFRVAYAVERPTPGGAGSFRVEIAGRLVSVPLTRHGLVAYELPNEIGRPAAGDPWPAHLAAADLGPRGLVPGRDPATVRVLEHRNPHAPRENRPGYYRDLAALSDAYQYVFSDQYLQRVADYAGVTHFVLGGAGGANPTLEGGLENGTTYDLDVGLLERGTLGALSASRNAAVFCFPAAGGRLVLTDSGVRDDPVLIAVAGPGGTSGAGSAELHIATPISRPVVIVGYNVSLSGIPGVTVNGAILLDPECSVPATAGPLTVGHLSHAAGGAVSPDAFRIRAISGLAEQIAPRVTYVATKQVFMR